MHWPDTLEGATVAADCEDLERPTSAPWLAVAMAANPTTVSLLALHTSQISKEGSVQRIIVEP
jgi:hypothetical protein